MTFTDRMVQRRQAIHVTPVDRALVLQKQLHDRHTADRRGSMQRQLTPLVLDSS